MPCPACLRGVHYRGQCLWNHGANPAYEPTTLESRWCCPDCSWRWVQALAAAGDGTGDAVPTAGLGDHMQSLVVRCLPGAGSTAAAHGRGSPRQRQVRRWVLSQLRDRGWTRVRALAGACQAAMPYFGRLQCDRAVRCAVSHLIQSGDLESHGNGTDAAIQIATGQASHRAVHQRRVRRRRPASIALEPAHPARSPRRRIE